MIQSNGSVSQKTVGEIIESEKQNKKRIKRNKDSLRELWDNIKGTNIYTIGFSEGEGRMWQRTNLKI